MNRRMTMEHNTTASRSGEWASRWAEDACAKATRAAVGAAEVEGADEADGPTVGPVGRGVGTGSSHSHVEFVSGATQT